VFRVFCTKHGTRPPAPSALGAHPATRSDSHTCPFCNEDYPLFHGRSAEEHRDQVYRLQYTVHISELLGKTSGQELPVHFNLLHLPQEIPHSTPRLLPEPRRTPKGSRSCPGCQRESGSSASIATSCPTGNCTGNRVLSHRAAVADASPARLRVAFLRFVCVWRYTVR
jgi:hypothetical protein